MKLSFWKPSFLLFVNVVSCETLVLEASYSHFLGMSRVKRSFWKSTFFRFLRMSRVNARFGSLFTFCECLV